jgi:glutamyl-tRNA reductase
MAVSQHIYTLGINHQSAPVAIRERMAFPPESLTPALRELVQLPGVSEGAILSTCNRTEIYCHASTPDSISRWLTHYHALESHHVEPYLYQHADGTAVKHAFRVASGLDSMVIGEPQILGQVKEAVRAARESGTLGLLLDKLFQTTFSVAKEVRSTTEIGANSVSMAAAALKLANRIFGSIKDQRVLFIGAGEMIELVATHFAGQTPKHITVANRTLERAKHLADKFHGSAITLGELPDHIANNDIIITSTASTLPILGKGMMESAIKQRKHRPVFMVDLAVPRDIEPEVSALRDVFLYTVDDLGAVVQEGLGKRESAVAAAETIIDNRVTEFAQWLDSRASVPTIRQLRERAEQYRVTELERAQRLLAKGEHAEQVLEALSRGLMNKFMHHPTRALQDVDTNQRAELIRLLNQLFPSNDQE